MLKIKSINLPLLLLIAFTCLFAQSTNALAYNVCTHLLDGGDIITAPINLRISLWASYQVDDEDFDENGDLNTLATHYGGYNGILSIDNTHTYFDDEDGYHKISTNDFADFPDPVAQTQMFLQLEYKYQTEPNTSYRVYDFVDDPPWENITRLLLIDDVSYITADAGRATNNNTFILDDNHNATTAVTLQFGGLLMETLAWNISNVRFELSDDLYINGGLEVTGGIDFSVATSFINRVETSTPATCTEGEQYYDSTENVLKICTATDTWSTLSITP